MQTLQKIIEVESISLKGNVLNFRPVLHFQRFILLFFYCFLKLRIHTTYTRAGAEANNFGGG